jgi:hypothetical protein
MYRVTAFRAVSAGNMQCGTVPYKFYQQPLGTMLFTVLAHVLQMLLFEIRVHKLFYTV